MRKEAGFMEVTEVKIFKKDARKKSNLLATANVIFDNEFVVYGFRLYEKEGKRFVMMPSRKINDEWANICHPITASLRASFERAVFEAYDSCIDDDLQ